MPRRYPPEFRRKVRDLIAPGRMVADVDRDLGVTGQTIYKWRNQDLVDRGERPAARRRIAELEAELAPTTRANELLKVAVPPNGAASPFRDAELAHDLSVLTAIMRG